MLWLGALEVDGVGRFAEAPGIGFPYTAGGTGIYGENMRVKTSLLNAIRYAFFGTVIGRGSRERRLHTLSNRERAAEGRFGFSVTLKFNHDGLEYELMRECRTDVEQPLGDHEYSQTV